MAKLYVGAVLVGAVIVAVSGRGKHAVDANKHGIFSETIVHGMCECWLFIF